MNVKNIVVPVQKEEYENFRKLLNIVNKRKINLITVSMGDRINVEKDLYFDVLWPDKANLISENSINNNSMVCKMNYRNFSILFTGDIEKYAEDLIFRQYKNNTKIFYSTILKVAHHGSKTSSTQDFLKIVKPKIALIGVGKDNKFGHPNIDVINRLENFRCENF